MDEWFSPEGAGPSACLHTVGAGDDLGMMRSSIASASPQGIRPSTNRSLHPVAIVMVVVDANR